MSDWRERLEAEACRKFGDDACGPEGESALRRLPDSTTRLGWESCGESVGAAGPDDGGAEACPECGRHCQQGEADAHLLSCCGGSLCDDCGLPAVDCECGELDDLDEGAFLL